MADPIVEQLRQLQCPAGSTPQLDLDTNTAGCFKPDGTMVEALAVTAPTATNAGQKIIGWAVLFAAALLAATVHVGGGKYGSPAKQQW